MQLKQLISIEHSLIILLAFWIVLEEENCVTTDKPKVPAKQSQHFNATYHNIVGQNMLYAFGHPFAMCCDMLGVKFETGQSFHATFADVA